MQLKTPIIVTKETVGLGNVDNTSDINKPVSTLQQAAIDNAGGGGASVVPYTGATTMTHTLGKIPTSIICAGWTYSSAYNSGGAWDGTNQYGFGDGNSPTTGVIMMGVNGDTIAISSVTSSDFTITRTGSTVTGLIFTLFA